MRRKPVEAMKKASFALSALAGALALAVGAVEVDGIAARVGTETILKSDVVLDGKRLTVRKSQALTLFSVVPSVTHVNQYILSESASE